jgi:hypothetical protein
MQKTLVLYILCLLAAPGLSAQTAAGSWYGKAEVDLAGMHDNYLTELVLKQKGNRVDGVFGYYFRDKYQSFVVHGHYNPQTREVTILNIPVIYYGSNSTVNSIDCNTNFRATLINTRLRSTLKGYFYHDERYTHMCPDLKVAYTLDRNEKQDSVLSAASATSASASVARIWTPQSDDYVVDASKSEQKADSAKRSDSLKIAGLAKKSDSAKQRLDSILTVAMQRVDTVKEQPDSAQAMSTQPAATQPLATTRGDSLIETHVIPVSPAKDTAQIAAITKPPAADAKAPAADPETIEKEDTKKIAHSFTKRAPVLNKVLLVESDSVRVSFYDNGEIDGDSISVFVNQELVLKHQELAARALTLYIRLDSTLETNEISMYAENLGKYPPNTALMVVTDGTNRYEVFMSSNLKENATIRLKRKRSN